MGTINELAADLVAARSVEATAREKRIQIEEAILAQCNLGEAERRTVSTDNGLKLTLQTGLSYKLTSKVLPEGVVPVKVTEKVELDVKAYEELRHTNPSGFAKASEWVVVTPKKASVTVGVL
jgi:hypothetical protein